METMLPEDVSVAPGKEDDLKCGFRSCRPEALQKCASMKLYAVILSFQFLFHMANFTYFLGVVRTVERRFGFSTRETGAIGSAGDALQTIFVLFIGYFGRKTHKPRYLSCSLCCSGIAAILLASPYFIYGPLKHQEVGSPSLNHSLDTTIGPHVEPTLRTFQMCDGDAADSSQCGSVDSSGLHTVESNSTAYGIFILAFIILNLGGAGLHSIGISFIDENVKKENSGVYIGFVTSMFSFGPILGFSLAAITTRMPEDLVDMSLSPRDPQFIGCWWLGSVIIGCLQIALALPLFFVPKHFPDYYRHHKVPSEKRNQPKTVTGTVVSELKQFPKSLWRLVSTPSVILLMMSKVFSLYFILGILVNMPRYAEIHFKQPAFVANIGTALGGALSGAAGNIFGGIIMKKGKIQPVGAARIYLLALLVTMSGICIMMFVQCPQSPLYGQTSPSQRSIETANQCNANCECDRDRFQSVCAPDGELYFSPCHAGCNTYDNGTYSDCSCTSGNVTSVSHEYCDEECSLYFPYLAVFMVISLLGNIARVPATILLFRLIDEEMKAFAMGILSSLINIAFVPGPIMYGSLYDSTCLLWQSKCGERGACLVYDVKSFRLYMHGVTLGFETVALLLAIIMHYYVMKHFNKEKPPIIDTLETEKEAMLALNSKQDNDM